MVAYNVGEHGTVIPRIVSDAEIKRASIGELTLMLENTTNEIAELVQQQLRIYNELHGRGAHPYHDLAQTMGD